MIFFFQDKQILYCTISPKGIVRFWLCYVAANIFPHKAKPSCATRTGQCTVLIFGNRMTSAVFIKLFSRLFALWTLFALSAFTEPFHIHFMKHGLILLTNVGKNVIFWFFGTVNTILVATTGTQWARFQTNPIRQTNALLWMGQFSKSALKWDIFSWYIRDELLCHKLRNHTAASRSYCSDFPSKNKFFVVSGWFVVLFFVKWRVMD